MGKILKTDRQPHSLIKTVALAAVFVFSPFISAQHTEIAPEGASGLQNLKLAEGKSFMAVTANPHATDTAYGILAQGGSAVDAAIAAQMVLGLVEPQSSGIGGGGFLLHWQQQQKKLQSFDGRETAPAAIDENHFLLKNGQSMPFYDAVVGGYAVGTPGLLAMLHQAHQQHGKLPWAELFKPAIQLAEQGFAVSQRLHLLLKYLQQTPKGISHASLRNYFFDSAGKPRPVGYPLKNPEYARSLRLIASQGPDVFYRGELAQQVVNAVSNDPLQSGKLSIKDMAGYKAVEREAVCKQVALYRLCGSPPPSSGASTVISIVAMLEQLPGYQGFGYDSPAFYHRFTEASKLAFADRNRYIADPDFAQQPLQHLLSDDYLQRRAAAIPLTRASIEPAGAGELAGIDHIDAGSYELPSTSHLSIIDAEGNIVSMTSSIETAFGSRIMVGGFILNNQLTDFSFNPVGKDQLKVANRIQAGKRPRSSMAPMMVFDQQQRPVMVVGSPGGSRIIGYVAKTLMQTLYHSASLQQSLNSAHVTNQNRVTEIELGREGGLKQPLEQLGHSVKSKYQTSGLHLIQISPAGYTGAADPRREGTARGE